MSEEAAAIKRAIQQRHTELRAQDSSMRTAALRAVSAQTDELFDALQALCAGTGHGWKFDHWNWDRTCAWDKCRWCGATEPAERHICEPEWKQP